MPASHQGEAVAFDIGTAGADAEHTTSVYGIAAADPRWWLGKERRT
jgi:hypothetical protein